MAAQQLSSGEAVDDFKRNNDNIKNSLAERGLSLAERQQRHKEQMDYAKLQQSKQKDANALTIAKINKN